VMASRGYPGAPLTGDEIGGLQKASAVPNVTIYHAATKRSGAKIVANGGRVLVLVGMGSDLQRARDAAYEAARFVDWPTGFYRRDIGARALRRG
jgi:phosphoribosylamine---glycine ligase